MIVKDIKNNTVCIINESTEQVVLKYKGIKTLVNLPVGFKYEIKRNATTTIVFHKTKKEYRIDSYLSN